MSLSFEDSLKKNMTETALPTAIETKVAIASTMNTNIDNMEVEDYSIMTLDESNGIAAYSGDDGNWNEHSKYDHYTVFSDDNISTISDTKDISLNRKQLSITQEINSQYIPFEMPRYYDGFDLKDTDIWVHYVTSGKSHGATRVINVRYNNEKIRFGWLIEGGSTIDAGALKFEIHATGSFLNKNKEPIAYVWKSKSDANLVVLRSICPDDEIVNEINDSWIEKVVTKAAEEIAEKIAGVEIGGQVEAAEKAAEEAMQSASEAQQYAKNASTAATNAVNTIIANYPTKDDIDKSLEDYIKTSDVNAKFGNLVNKEGQSLTVEDYVKQEVDAVDVSEQIGELGTDKDGNLITNVVDYVDMKVGDVDVSEQLKNYYTKSETYSKGQVDDLLDNVDLTGYATEKFVTDKTDVLSGRIDTNAGSITTITSKISEINQTIESIDKSPNAQYITTYNQPFTFEGEEFTGENMLVLYEIYNKDKENEVRTVVSSHEIKGGSGASVSSSKIERITSTPLIERLGNKVVLSYSFTNDDTGVGYATWKIGSRTIINKKNIHNGINSEDLTDYISLGSDQKVTLIVTDDANTIIQMVWYVSIVDIKLTSNFDDTRYYAAGSPVDFTFIPSGAVDKTIHFLLDGEEIGTKTSIKSSSDLLDSYQIPAQGHGSHLVEAYVTATINNTTIGENRSIYVAKDIVWFDNENDIPVIGCATPVIDTVQYNTVNIKYTVFDKDTETPEVTWYVNETAMPSEVLTEKDEDGYYTYSHRANDIGTFELKITCGNAEPKIITLNVEELNIDVSPVTTGLAFDFNPSGYSNNSANRLWTDGDVFMSVSDNFDWVNGGYQYDENGDQYFCVKSGTTATINYNLFADDAKTQGKEFKVIFKTSNIKNRDTTFLSCMNSSIGLDMKIQDANIYSSNGSLYSPYCEEDIIEFEFNINTIDNIPLAMTYEDGVGCRPMIYTSDASFWQTTPQPITIGSPDCDVYIYRMKAYARSLSDSEILSNFILDGRNANEIANRYNKNKIYESVDEDGKKILSIKGTLTPESVADACPDLRVIIVDAPWFTNDKDNKVDDTTITMIHKNGRPEDNWTCTGAKHSGQGTSSNEYGYAGRNIDLIMDGDTSLFKWVDENGSEVESKTITLTETSVPTDYLNVKVNIASSENQNNAQMARRYNEYNPFVRSAKFNDNKVKDCMEFYNCVIFVRESNPDISTHREFNDCNTHFYAIGNVGDSKKTDDTRVNDKNDPRECVIEITDYNVPLAEFPTGNGKNICSLNDWKEGNTAYDLLYAEYQYKDGKFKSFGSKSYEFRYEMKGITEEQREVNINAWRDFYKFVVTSTDEEFYNRLKEYFVIDSALYYYLFTERYTMVDNRAKNSFWNICKVYITEDEAITLGNTAGGFIIDNEQAAINDGYRWNLAWGYDFDTSLGIDNTGKLVLTYGKEDSDYYVDGDPSSSYIYRAAESKFFCRIRDLFKSELQTMFVDRESKNAWSAISLIDQWDKAQAQFPEELWRLDIQRKYLRTYLGTSIDNSIAGASKTNFLPNMMNGRKKYQRRMFERNQELYMATKYFGTTATQDQIRIRFNNPESYVVKPDFTLYITPYSDMYIGVSFYNGHKENFRAKSGIEYTVHYPEGLETADITLIYGASFIQEIGDLSKCYAGADTDFSKATRLQRLVIGSDIDGYFNSYMDKVPLTNNKLLEYLDIRNVTGLKETIDLSQCGNMLELYAQGSGAKGVIFANGGKIKKFYLPSITSLTAKNLNYIEDFNIESYINLQTLVVENTPAIDTHEIIDETLDIQSSLPEDSAKLNVLRLIGIDWDMDNTGILDDVILLRGQNVNGGETSQSILIGAVYTDSIKERQLEAYNKAWPDLEIDYPESGLIKQYPVTFVNADDTPLLNEDGEPMIQYVDVNGFAVDPSKYDENSNPTFPTIESDIDYSYTFAKKWVVQSTGDAFDFKTPIRQAITLKATYTKSLRTYEINYVTKTKTITNSGLYGSNIAYDYEEHGIPEYVGEESANTFYLFSHWDKSGFLLEGKNGTDLENGVKIVNAIYDKFSYDETVNGLIEQNENPDVNGSYTIGNFKGLELSDLSPVHIYALTKLGIGNIPMGQLVNGSYEGLKEGDPYTIVVGNDVDYSDIDYDLLISQETSFGNSNYEDTGIQLFDTNKDFVLAIDYKFLGQKSGTLLQCLDAYGNSRGFKLWYNGSDVLFTYDGVDEIVTEANKREMIVIRNAKDEDSGEYVLSIYNSDLDNGANKIEPLKFNRKIVADTNASLVLGASYSYGEYGNFVDANINWAKIWLKDLGDNTCQSLVMWTHETIDLNVCGFKRYILEDRTKSSFSLLASHLLERTKQWNNGYNANNDGGWAESDLNELLNNRLYKAMPIQVRHLLKPMIVWGNDGIGSSKPYYTNVTSSNCYITIPAIVELCSKDGSNNYQTLSPYKDEIQNGDDDVTKKTISYMINDGNRIRAFRDGSASVYWTRSPDVNYSNYVWCISENGSTKTISGTQPNNSNGVLIEISF